MIVIKMIDILINLKHKNKKYKIYIVYNNYYKFQKNNMIITMI